MLHRNKSDWSAWTWQIIPPISFQVLLPLYRPVLWALWASRCREMFCLASHIFISKWQYWTPVNVQRRCITRVTSLFSVGPGYQKHAQSVWKAQAVLKRDTQREHRQRLWVRMLSLMQDVEGMQETSRSSLWGRKCPLSSPSLFLWRPLASSD